MKISLMKRPKFSSAPIVVGKICLMKKPKFSSAQIVVGRVEAPWVGPLGAHRRRRPMLGNKEEFDLVYKASEIIL